MAATAIDVCQDHGSMGQKPVSMSPTMWVNQAEALDLEYRGV